MFSAAGTLSALSGAKLERLRLSLNTPVVALERLPVGPAAAGIALHRGEQGLRLTLAVRSARSGQTVFFHPDGWGEDEPTEVLLDAALSFAEGMGFLFDEDLLDKGLDAAQAVRAWEDFLEDALPEEESWARLEEAAARPAPAAPGLSKFRFLSSIPAERLLTPPPPPPPAQKPTRSHFVMRLLSRF